MRVRGRVPLTGSHQTGVNSPHSETRERGVREEEGKEGRNEEGSGRGREGESEHERWNRMA